MTEGVEIAISPEYTPIMQQLEKTKRVSVEGQDYWLAREICPILAYTWEGFDGVLQRAMATYEGIGSSPNHHFRQTSTMMKLGKGGQRESVDYFLSRSACYLIAMNGDPSKPEIAAAQAYFAIQTRRMELEDRTNTDERRLELREKVSSSFKKVSGVAKIAGVRNEKQAIFHDARYQGLYGMRYAEVKEKKGLTKDEQLFDRAGALELSANDFQMNLAADVISKNAVCNETAAIQTNLQVGQRVRSVIIDSGVTVPENLPLEAPISTVKKQLKSQKKLPKKV